MTNVSDSAKLCHQLNLCVCGVSDFYSLFLELDEK